MNNCEDHGPFINLVGNNPAMKIVHFLISNAPYNYNKTQIAKEIGMSRKTLYSAWHILEAFDIVRTISSDGKTRFYVLDKEKPVTKALLRLHMATTAHAQGGLNELDS